MDTRVAEYADVLLRADRLGLENHRLREKIRRLRVELKRLNRAQRLMWDGVRFAAKHRMCEAEEIPQTPIDVKKAS